MHDVGVVKVLPVHRGKEEELGDGVEAAEDIQEGAKEEIPEDKCSFKNITRIANATVTLNCQVKIIVTNSISQLSEL